MNLKRLISKGFVLGCAVFFMGVAAPSFALAQDFSPENYVSNMMEVQARSVDASHLQAGQTKISLWGVDAIYDLPVAMKARARVILDNAVGVKPIRCEVKERKSEEIIAQCVNDQDLDLSLLMLQEGYVIVDRSVVYNSAFEETYIEAERFAAANHTGIWAVSGAEKGSALAQEGSWVVVAGFMLVLVMIASFSILSLIIMRGFRQVIEAQNHGSEMAGRERQLRDKERNVIAKMLDSEIKANKSKIEAYLVVYEEMLSSLRDPDRQPKYKKTGDIVQKQPVLNRSVFDLNTDKLDILGDRLCSQVVHFYARIKTKPDYINLEPETPLDEAISTVEKCVKTAHQLNQISNDLIDAFNECGMSSDVFDY